MKMTIVAGLCALWGSLAMAQTVSYPFPGSDDLISGQPAGETGWYSRTSIKYMHLLGPLEYGGESSMPAMIVNDDDGNAYIGNMFSDFEGAGWLKGSSDASTGSISLNLPQIIFDEEYGGEHFYYYACRVSLNEEMTDMVLTADQTITLLRDDDGNYAAEGDDTAIGICYVYDPEGDEYPEGAGYEGCELQWFGIAYADIQWAAIKSVPTVIPSDVKIEKYAMCHNTGARFVDVAEVEGRILIAGLAEDPSICIAGNIEADDRTVTFATNQFLGVMKSGDYFTYMVAAAPEEFPDPESGEILNTIAPTDKFTATLDRDKKSLSFSDPGTGFAIANGESKVGGGDLYINPRLTQQDDYIVAAPASPEIVMHTPYTESQGFGTFNFNLPVWTPDGLLIDRARMYYNIYLDDDVMTLEPDIYSDLNEEIRDIPYDFTDYYDIFSVGINHALYLYCTGYDRIGVQSFTVAEDGTEYRSPIVYTAGSATDRVDEIGATAVETYFIDLSGRRMDNPENGFAIKCTHYDDGSIRTEKRMIKTR